MNPRTITARDVADFHAHALSRPGWPDHSPAEHETGVWHFIESNHRLNGRLWEQEDQARRLDVDATDIVANKRAIDALNQSRNDAIEHIDEAMLEAMAAAPVGDDARLHSETVGAIIDRLSILSLKIHHHGLHRGKREAELNRRKRELESQLDDLVSCLDTLLRECWAGKAYFKVYRQHKMYNDPDLNPYLSRE